MNNGTKKIMFCGGGSAGHVIPNISICEQIKDRYQICYIGTGAIEKSICKSNNITFFQFEGVKLVRGKIFCNLLLPFKLIKSIRECRKIIKREMPDLVFCKGGYVSVPPALAAKKYHIPVLTHESDLSLGLANAFIASKCRHVLTAFPTTAEKVKNGVCVGTPMRKNLFDRDKVFAKLYYGFDMRPTIIVFGGGSGSAKINANIRQIASKLCKNYNILHICGKGNVIYSNINGYKQIEFAEDMGMAYACADYAVARCGANSAHELIALKIPTLFIPLENKRSRGDQLLNAEFFACRNLCHILREGDLNGQTLQTEIEKLIGDQKLKAALKGCSFECGNKKIIDEIENALSAD